MSAKFNMDGYVDVAERIAMFIDKYPDGSLQSELEPVEQDGKLVGWLCRAEAYRTPDDPRPGIGHAVEPVPGRTPYTKDSEAMNAETSAWGRAIIALGFETKKIASANEVRNRQTPTPEPPVEKPESLTQFEGLLGKCADTDPEPGHTHSWYLKLADAAAKREYGKDTVAELDGEQLAALATKFQEHLAGLAGSVGETAAAGTDGPSGVGANGDTPDAPTDSFVAPTTRRKKATA